MTTTAKSVIQRAADLLQDQTSVRWPVSELVRWLNDAQRTVVKLRPDSMNTTTTMMLIAGSRQDLSNASLTPLPLKLIEITRNMAASSTKQSVRLVERNIMDAQKPGWHNLAGTVNITDYMFDSRSPRAFYVYPPATALAQLEVMYAAYPTDVAEPASGALYTDVTGNLSLPDIYADDLLNMVMFRAYSKDAEFAGSAERAAGYLSLVTASLGAEIAATVAIEPKAKP